MISDKKMLFNIKNTQIKTTFCCVKLFLKIPSLTLRSEIDQYKVIQSSPYIIIKPRGDTAG